MTVMPVSVGLFSLLFSNSAFCGKAVMIFAEPTVEKLRSFVTCFEIEGSGHRLAALTGLLDENLGVVKWMVLIYQETLWANYKVLVSIN
jgi:hypothetical protein